MGTINVKNMYLYIIHENTFYCGIEIKTHMTFAIAYAVFVNTYLGTTLKKFFYINIYKLSIPVYKKRDIIFKLINSLALYCKFLKQY